MRNSLLISLLGVLALLLAACGTPANSDVQPPRSDDAQTSPTIAPPTYREPASPITADNANLVQYLGRLDTPTSEKSSIFSHSFSPDGTRLAALDNNLIIVWDLITGHIVFSGDRNNAIRVFYSPDKTEVYTVNGEGEIRVYDEEGAVQNTLEGLIDFADAYAYDNLNGILAMGGEGGSVRVWDPAKRTALASFRTNDAPIVSLKFSQDGKVLASMGRDGHVTIWNWETHEQLADLDHEAAIVFDAIFNSDGTHITTATQNYIAVWTIETGELDYALELEQGGASGIFAYTPDDSKLVTAGLNAPLNVWDAATGNLIGQLTDVSGNRMAAAFSADGNLMVTSVLDTGVNLWNLASANEETIPGAELDLPTNRITDVAWTEDGFLIAFFGADGTVYLWGIAGTAS
ncbi:MAG: PD40 domain-containing protein [Anaerolineae bacterium]|nr:PD40 domain-containing protein [Anaerolineae bacterium]